MQEGTKGFFLVLGDFVSDFAGPAKDSDQRQSRRMLVNTVFGAPLGLRLMMRKT
jgi:hypothetical protein